MQIPNYEEEFYPSPAEPLYGVYQRFIGEHEADNGYALRGEFDGYPVTHASLAIGRACRIANDGDQDASQQMIRKTIKSLRETGASDPDTDRYSHEASRLANLAALVNRPEDAAVVSGARDRMHRATVGRVAFLQSQLWNGGGHPRLVRHSLQENLAVETSLALVTRLHHPWLTAVPALPHHTMRHPMVSGLSAFGPHSGMMVESTPRASAFVYPFESTDILNEIGLRHIGIGNGRKVVAALIHEAFGEIDDDELMFLDDYSRAAALVASVICPVEVGGDGRNRLAS